MLYKKIHRQFLREFWEGRWFECKGCMYKVDSKPYIRYIYARDSFTISISVGKFSSGSYIPSTWGLFFMTGQHKGKIKQNKIKLDKDRNNKGRLRCYIKRFIDNFLEILGKMIKRLSIENHI